MLSIALYCRCPTGLEAPEMAEDFEVQGYYNPVPSHDIWTFGLLLLEMAGGKRPYAHDDAIAEAEAQQDASKTRAFARGQLHGEEYYQQVMSPCLSLPLFRDRCICCPNGQLIT